MAGFEPRSLCLVNSVPYGTAGAKVNFFHYATGDAAATVLTDGYFNAARDKLQVNDVIEAMTVAGGTGDKLSIKVTASPASGNVTVAVNTDASGA
ncbi:hypothetical protein MPL1032_190155 [Mesorhizobium plurifarium]|uniref:Uncharacterized protein n=1 Tax=Mesorhizobium plurifarium TaxID=69974 RepID=A0A0K2VVL7_MESPL|nr:hypothetical protein MPL1032_190155 [Mesorhizobium plurifarium]